MQILEAGIPVSEEVNTAEVTNEQVTTIEFKDRHELSRQAAAILKDDISKLQELLDLGEIGKHFEQISAVTKRIESLDRYFGTLNNMFEVPKEQEAETIEIVTTGLKRNGFEIKDATETIIGLKSDGLTSEEVQDVRLFFHDIRNDLNRIVMVVDMMDPLEEEQDESLNQIMINSTKGLGETVATYLKNEINRKTNVTGFLDVTRSLADEMKINAPEIDVDFLSAVSTEMKQSKLKEYQVAFHPAFLRAAVMNALQNILRINEASHTQSGEPQITKITLKVFIKKPALKQPEIVVVIDDNGPGFPEAPNTEKQASHLDGKQVSVYKPEVGKTVYSSQVKGTGIALAQLDHNLQKQNGSLLVGNLSKDDNVLGARVELRIPMERVELHKKAA